MKSANIPASLEALVEKIEDDYKLETTVTGIPTGYNGLDRMTAGMHPGDLIVVASRPSSGKTSFVTNIAVNVALESKLPVSIFNMETDVKRLAMRIVAATGGIRCFGMLSASIEDEEWLGMTQALGVLNDAPIELMDSIAIGWNAGAIEKTLLDRNDPPGLLIVDGLMSFDISNCSSSYDRNVQLYEHARVLKRLALSLNIPIVMTATIGRELEGRPNKRPVMKDIRDIGGLEDLADVILFIYRDDLYNSDSADKGLSEIIVSKQRNGPTGRIGLAFNSEYLRFDNLV